MESLHKQSANHTLRQRCQRVLLKATGRTSHDIGQVIGLCDVSVNSWLKRYQEKGIKELETKPGRGRKRLLTVAADEEAVRVAVAANRQSPAHRPGQGRVGKSAGGGGTGRKPRHLPRFFKSLGGRYKRIRRRPAKEPDPLHYAETVERLAEVEAWAEAGERTLFY